MNPIDANEPQKATPWQQAVLWPVVCAVLAIGSVLVTGKLSASEAFTTKNPHSAGQLQQQKSQKPTATTVAQR